MIQILALLTMERPKSLSADDLSDQKVFILFGFLETSCMYS